MLAGAYSKRFQSLEKHQVNHLKDIRNFEKRDGIARSKRLSQETNKRRKAQAQKRKNELQREEKRRQEILSRRREEQQMATEKYQRSNVPTSRRSSPTRTNLEEALKLIRGSPPLSRQNSQNSTGSYRKKHSPQAFGTYAHDPLNRPYLSRYTSEHLRPQSPQEQAKERAELLDKSLRNYTDSRSLFEQQLEQHQQLLLEEQKQSLHSFNQAIQDEIDADAKLQGTEEEAAEDVPWMTRSDSLSSVDSLEASQDSFRTDQPKSNGYHNGGEAKGLNSKTNSYPRPVQPKATPIIGRVVPNTASVTDDSLESKPFQVEYLSKSSGVNSDKGAIVGPILNGRAVDQPSYVLHPGPPNHQLMHLLELQQQQQQQQQQQMHQVAQVRSQGPEVSYPQAPVKGPQAAQTTADGLQLPASHGHMTTDPPTSNGTTFTTVTTISSVLHNGVSVNSESQKIPVSTNSKAWDNLPSTLNLKHDYSEGQHSKVNSTSHVPTSSSTHATSAQPPASRGVTSVQQKPASSTMPVLEALTTSHKSPNMMTTTSYLTSATKPSPATTHTTTSPPSDNQNHKDVVPGRVTTTVVSNGSILNGTLGLVNGRLSVMPDSGTVATNQDVEAATSPQKLMPQKALSDLEFREVRGILKRPESGKLRKVSSTGNLHRAGLNVKDSLEVTRGHQKVNMNKKQPQPRKKSVRFADLHYEEDIPEDNDSVDSNTESATPVKKVTLASKNTAGKGTPKPPARTRPLSAKVTGSNRIDARIARAASAGTTRPGQPQHAQDRPRAAAHIIAHSIEGAEYLNEQAGTQSTNGISVTQPEKKVTVVTNNFMGKTAVASKAPTAPSQGVIYTAPSAYTEDREEVPVTTATVLQKADSVASNYQSKYIASPAASDLPPDTAMKQAQQPVYNENGLRIDRTPTDDEINWLWEKVRTCLHREPSSSSVTTDPALGMSRQAAPVSNKYIDGNSLGLGSNTRVSPAFYGNSVQQRAMNNMAVRQRPATAAVGYSHRFGLLQQRKQQGTSAKKASSRQNSAPTFSNTEPQVDRTHVNRNDVNESMAHFLAAEYFAGKSMSESQVQLAMEETKRRQEEIASERVAQRGAGPSALSMEEQKLMESLDRLNEKLKIKETKPSGPLSSKPPVQHYVHSGGFRGHNPISHQNRRQSDIAGGQQLSGTTSALRIHSARHYR